MKLLKAIFSVALLIFFSNCSSIKVIADYDREVDFSRYKTYRTYPPSTEDLRAASIHNPDVAFSIESLIGERSVNEGLSKSADPDLSVVFFIKAVRLEKLDRTTSFNMGTLIADFLRCLLSYS